MIEVATFRTAIGNLETEVPSLDQQLADAVIAEQAAIKARERLQERVALARTVLESSKRILELDEPVIIVALPPVVTATVTP